MNMLKTNPAGKEPAVGDGPGLFGNIVGHSNQQVDYSGGHHGAARLQPNDVPNPTTSWWQEDELAQETGHAAKR